MPAPPPSSARHAAGAFALALAASCALAPSRWVEERTAIVDLLNAQAALELARAEDVRARTDHLVGLAQLARATGRLDLEGTKSP